MADEEKQDQVEETTEDEAAAADDPATGDASAASGPLPESGSAEASPAPEPPADDAAEAAPEADEPEEEAPAEEEPPAAEAPAGDDEEAEQPTPKQLRKRERSRHKGDPRPPRAPEERASERTAARRGKAADRRRYRTGHRQRGGEPGTGTAPAERAPGPKKVRLGKVVSTKADKTITVRIEVARRHPTYEKIVRRSATLHAHDAENEAQEGDTVRVVETRPLSKTKRWRLLEVIERAR
jgi:small subunit ribosomal protein S17